MHSQETTKNLNPTINILFKIYRLILDCIPHYTVLLKCNVALARMYFPRISILDTLLSTSIRTNSTRVERGVEADVEDSIG